jgi:hypothetical protein
MTSSLRLIPILALAIASTGCVEYKSNITGTVTRDGKPLVWKSEEGTLLVLFVPEDRTRFSPKHADFTDPATGAYRFAELPAGKYTVAIQMFDEKYNDALNKHFDAYRTTIQCEVTEDNQVIDIDLPKDLPKGGGRPEK